MFCSNCGAKLPETSRFCENCGCAVANVVNTDRFNSTPASNNPYATPSAPAPTTQYLNQPVQNFPNTPPQPPQYLRPVQTPQGVQYIPAEPIVTVKKPATYNPFVFVAAGIMAAMFLLCFMPWFTVNDKGFNLFDVFTYNIYLEDFEMDAVGLCSFLMIIAMALLIPSAILALVRKNQMPIGFSIAASVITLISLFFFVALLFDSTGDVEATSVPLTMLVLSVANIIFPPVARNVRK